LYGASAYIAECQYQRADIVLDNCFTIESSRYPSAASIGVGDLSEDLKKDLQALLNRSDIIVELIDANLFRFTSMYDKECIFQANLYDSICLFVSLDRIVALYNSDVQTLIKECGILMKCEKLIKSFIIFLEKCISEMAFAMEIWGRPFTEDDGPQDNGWIIRSRVIEEFRNGR
jgi:hypothetical protein